MNDRAADISTADGDRDEPGPSAEADEPAEGHGAVEIAAAPGLADPPDLDWVRDRLRAALPLIEQRFERPVGRVTIQVIDDDRMIDLQARFHPPDEGEAATTDVLTFDLSTTGGPLVVEIALCAEEARRSAARLGHPAERELLLYALHGVLHCLGLDDHDPEGFRSMHAEEDRLLEAIGVGATFAASGRPPGAASPGAAS